MKRVLVCALLLAWSGMASAVVYKWADAQGKLQYGDRPPDGVHAEVVDMQGSHAAPSEPARPAASSTPPAPKDDSVRRSVDSDVAQAREKQCAAAQDRYTKLIEGRKLYKSGPDGERQYLSSAEIDEQRLSAREEVDATCNSSN